MKKESVGFHFTEIPLEEATNALLAGDGAYAEIKQALLDRLPKLSAGTAFAFGLPQGKEVPEDQRKSLATAVNKTLTQASLYWRVKYSSNKKLFICTPQSKLKNYVPHSRSNPKLDEEAIIKMYKDGMSIPEISAKVGTPKNRISYLCYSKYKYKSVPKPKGQLNVVGGGK